jgi:hypothetical protein
VWLLLHSSVLRKSYVDVTGPGLHVIEYDTSQTIDEDFALGIFYQAYLEQREPRLDQMEHATAVYSKDVLENETLFLEIKKVTCMTDLFIQII